MTHPVASTGSIPFDIQLTPQEKKIYQLSREAGMKPAEIARQRRAFCRACLDWSERRHHLAGALGAALLARFYDLGWASRGKNSRAIRFTAMGERKFRSLFSRNFQDSAISA